MATWHQWPHGMSAPCVCAQRLEAGEIFKKKQKGNNMMAEDANMEMDACAVPFMAPNSRARMSCAMLAAPCSAAAGGAYGGGADFGFGGVGRGGGGGHAAELMGPAAPRALGLSFLQAGVLVANVAVDAATGAVALPPDLLRAAGAALTGGGLRVATVVAVSGASGTVASAVVPVMPVGGDGGVAAAPGPGCLECAAPPLFALTAPFS
eukprot:361877-Chlamydomonas_euryale.AAC.3